MEGAWKQKVEDLEALQLSKYIKLLNWRLKRSEILNFSLIGDVFSIVFST